MWISASSTFNYFLNDPLLDWLKYHKKFKLPKHKVNFPTFLQNQGLKFETKVYKLLQRKFKFINLNAKSNNLTDFNKTLSAMKQGIPLISQALVRNDTNNTYGIVDLLIRSDYLNHLTNTIFLTKNDIKIKAPILGKNWHYRVVDIKYTTLLLRADGLHLLNSGTFPAYKSQLLIYNQALGQMQGYTPPQTYILGRKWKYQAKGHEYKGNKCFDTLGVIDYETIDNKFINLNEKALQWLAECRSKEAKNWNYQNYPLSRKELYPNMSNSYDYPWQKTKQEIAVKNKELTSLWMVGPKNRSQALEQNIYSWQDSKCCAKNLSILGPKVGPTLDKIIKINQQEKDIILPQVINNNLNNWKEYNALELYIDFEMINGVMGNMELLPKANCENMIFMFGIGYISPNSGKWKYHNFTTKYLNKQEEEKNIKKFIKFIDHKRNKYELEEIKLFHWSGAEPINWHKIIEKYNLQVNFEINWIDMLKVFKEEPIVIKDCLNFSLKNVAKALFKHKLIKNIWTSECEDGQDAVIKALMAHKKAKRNKCSMKKYIKQIIDYNEIDVKVIYEIVDYLRKNHLINKKRK